MIEVGNCRDTDPETLSRDSYREAQIEAKSPGHHTTRDAWLVLRWYSAVTLGWCSVGMHRDA